MKKDRQVSRPSETVSHIQIAQPDPWSALRRWTPARIALGRAGGSVPTAALLDFRLAHARAVDAVHLPFNAEALAEKLDHLGIGVICLTSGAANHSEYLHRPDLGRVLSTESRCGLKEWAGRSPRCDLVVIISDGLSALAVERQAPLLLAALLPLLQEWNLAPLMIVRHARVALQDHIGPIVGAQLALMLIGERPGLIAPDSLSAYLVYGPKPGNTDADRNCVSNIRPGGLEIPVAAAKLHYLLTEARRRRLSGIALKDESGSLSGTDLVNSQRGLLG